ncbi:MAG: sigma-54 dependent transcriptional regulator [Pseudomonadota bacterium]
MSTILIIDDDFMLCHVLMKLCKKMGLESVFALTLTDGLRLASEKLFDVVFLDVNLPDGNGLQAISTLKHNRAAPEIIIMTGNGDPDGAELAIRSGVWDYIQKGSSNKGFDFSLLKALEYRAQKQNSIQLKRVKRGSIVGNSQRIQDCLDKVMGTAITDLPVLITGETGTGKELFARAIHENSQRLDHGFVVVDCAALPEHLVESVLFGHVRGAFTGADSDKTGLMIMADGGTLFLDEVGELPMTIQKKFLRALQEKKIRPIGARQEIRSDFRLIAATHRDIPAMIDAGQFREDLYYRICAVMIQLPPLRERKEDIPLLVDHHLHRKREIFNELPRRLSQEFFDELEQYIWPGNVRELINAVDSACSAAYNEPILFPKHLPDHIRAFNIKKRLGTRTVMIQDHPVSGQHAAMDITLKAYLNGKRQEYITNLMAHTNGDIAVACSVSGLSRGHLYSLLKQYGIAIN